MSTPVREAAVSPHRAPAGGGAGNAPAQGTRSRNSSGSPECWSSARRRRISVCPTVHRFRGPQPVAPRACDAARDSQGASGAITALRASALSTRASLSPRRWSRDRLRQARVACHGNPDISAPVVRKRRQQPQGAIRTTSHRRADLARRPTIASFCRPARAEWPGPVPLVAPRVACNGRLPGDPPQCPDDAISARVHEPSGLSATAPSLCIALYRLSQASASG